MVERKRTYGNYTHWYIDGWTIFSRGSDEPIGLGYACDCFEMGDGELDGHFIFEERGLVNLEHKLGSCPHDSPGKVPEEILMMAKLKEANL